MNKIINRNNNKIMTKLNKPEQINSNRTIKHHFIDGPFIEILDKKQGKYTVEFIDKQNGNSIYKIEINNNNWCKTLKKYFVDWEITIKGVGCDLKYNFNAKNKNVLINFESKSVGDTLGWIPYVEEFRLKHNCNIICSTFHNNLFIDGYPEIKFVEPGATVNNIYAQFRIGYYLNGDSYDTDKHPADPRNIPLQKIAADILGLEFKEIKPKLKKTLVTSSKKVTIGFHSTAQCKYWNNPNGWQEVVDYLLENGYEPIVISKEENGYMGNKFPVGVKHIGNLDLAGTMEIIQESDFFIGISSGLSWLAWACDIPTIIISGFTDKDMEPHDNVWRVINEDVCNSCMAKLSFDPSDWNWCPINKNTENQFICSKSISSKLVIDEIKKIMNYKPNRPLP
jgi:autotransporter strand-loop-strand O-heptosyltransferase